MNIPERVVVNAIPWEITKGELVNKDEHTYGVTDRVAAKVVIPCEPPQALREQTFWHELFHMLAASHDIGGQELDEEGIATLYGPALYAFLKHNCHITWKMPVLDDDA